VTAGDWRFLLPVPEGGYGHLAVLGGPPALLAFLEESGLARRVASTLPPDRSADAIAVLHGSGVAPWEAARGLAPGGVLYAEVQGAYKLRWTVRRLRAMGLRATGAWAFWPRFDLYQVAAPLHVEGALRWWAETLYPARTIRKRMIEAVLRTLDGRGAWALTRCFGVMAGPSPPWPPSPIPSHPPGEGGNDKIGFSGGRWRPSPGGREGMGEGTGVRGLLLSHGAERAIILPFPLSTVLKVPRRAAFVLKTEAEQCLLDRARSLADESTRRAIPQPGGMVRWGTSPAGSESFAPGVSLERSGVRWGRPLREKIEDLRIAASWITAFQAGAVLRREPWGPCATAEWIEAPFAVFRGLCRAGEREERLLERAQRHAASLAGLPLPIVWRHRDFTPWNLFRAGDELRVVDWEGLRPGPALCDLLHFAIHWHEQARRVSGAASRRAAFRDLFVAPHPGPAAAAARGEIAVCCRRLGIDLRFVPLLLLHTRLEIAARRAERPGGAPGPWDAADAAYVTFLADAGEALFEAWR
jgi:aminoglycoside phosphotransferase (APT) family kinase protein